MEISIPSFFCNSIPFIKTRNHLIFPAASLQEVSKWSLGSVSTLGRSATYIITRITVCIKCQFLIKLVFPCSSYFILLLVFCFLTTFLSFLFYKEKIKEGLRKVQGTKSGSLHFCISLCNSPLFSFEKITET